jgi:hypothetical protein
MSDFVSVVERIRRALTAVAELQRALAREPNNISHQINILAWKRVAEQSEKELHDISQTIDTDICRYRLVSYQQSYGAEHVGASLGAFQGLFSQLYDAGVQGPKARAVIGFEQRFESQLNVEYTYSGSLGIVLSTRNPLGLFDGNLDRSVRALLDVVDISSRDGVREVAKSYGAAVVKRLHDWSDANLKGLFSPDVRWRRSDGYELGKYIELDQLQSIVNLIQATSEEEVIELKVSGILVGGDIANGTFHFVVPNGDDFRGILAIEFDRETTMTLGNRYNAVIRERRQTVYATEKVSRTQELLWLGGL